MIEKLRASAPQESPRALVLCPTRELANQVHGEIAKFQGDLRSCCIYGGTPYQPQIANLRRGVDIVVGTPGRVLEMLGNGHMSTRKLEFLTLDEADMMLDIGFGPDMKSIMDTIRTHKGLQKDQEHEYQTLLFSATVPPWVKKLCSEYFRAGFETVDLIGTDRQASPDTIEHIAIPATAANQASILIDLLRLHGTKKAPSLVFTTTKHEANVLHQRISNFFSAAVLHGSYTQAEREKTLQLLKNGSVDVLICTDVAARGLDIKNVCSVFQMGITGTTSEMFLHRSGRTGRAGKSGKNIVLFDPASEHGKLKSIQSATRVRFQLRSSPQPGEILERGMSALMPKVEEAAQCDLQQFMKPAAALLERLPPNVAVATLLRLCANWDSVVPRSSLTGMPDKQTVMVHSSRKFTIPWAKWMASATSGDVRSHLYDIPAGRVHDLKQLVGEGIEVELIDGALPTEIRFPSTEDDRFNSKWRGGNNDRYSRERRPDQRYSKQDTYANQRFEKKGDRSATRPTPKRTERPHNDKRKSYY